MDETRYIIAGSLIDGSGGAVRRNHFLAVRGGEITAIGSASALPRHELALVEDFSHCTILPALVDCSVLLSRSSSLKSGDVTAGDADLLTQHSHYCHIHGVLGVAAGDDPAGLLPEHFQQIRAAVGQIAIRSAGADFLKIHYSAAIDEESAPPSRLNFAEMGRLLRQRGGKKAVVVANGPRAVAEALAAGCDAIEQGYAMGEENLKMMAALGVLWIPSLLKAKNALDGSRAGGDVCCRFSQRYVAPGKPVPGAEALWQKTLVDQLAQLRLAGKLGVTSAVGTGAGSAGIIHGEAVVEEMKLFIKAGYSLTETIRCTSETGAVFFGLEKLGALAVGRRATFLIARGTPAQLPRKLSYLEGIHIDGAPSGVYRKNPVKPGR